MSSTLVIIPALNEEAALPRVIAGLRSNVPDCDVLVVDDGSTDDTAAVARAAGANVVSLPFNMGVGTALRTGFRFAARRDYTRVVQSDADGQHDAGHIQTLLRALDDGADLAIGSRFLAGDDHYEVGGTRSLAMRILKVCTGVLLGQKIYDSTSGFRGFSRPLVEEFATSYPREFLSDTVEALVQASYKGYRVDEVPVKMQHRIAGEPTHRSVRLAYHYVRLLTVLAMNASWSGRRTSRRKRAAT